MLHDLRYAIASSARVFSAMAVYRDGQDVMLVGTTPKPPAQPTSLLISLR